VVVLSLSASPRAGDEIAVCFRIGVRLELWRAREGKPWSICCAHRTVRSRTALTEKRVCGDYMTVNLSNYSRVRSQEDVLQNLYYL
jgi:hypothetical protein